MWLPSYNLSSYNYKLLYFNLNTIWRRNNKSSTSEAVHMALVTIGVPQKDYHSPRITIHKIQIWTIFFFILDLKFKIPSEFYEL